MSVIFVIFIGSHYHWHPRVRPGAIYELFDFSVLYVGTEGDDTDGVVVEERLDLGGGPISSSFPPLPRHVHLTAGKRLERPHNDGLQMFLNGQPWCWTGETRKMWMNSRPTVKNGFWTPSKVSAVVDQERAGTWTGRAWWWLTKKV